VFFAGALPVNEEPVTLYLNQVVTRGVLEPNTRRLKHQIVDHKWTGDRGERLKNRCKRGCFLHIRVVGE
jgi:hypothetical protein